MRPDDETCTLADATEAADQVSPDIAQMLESAETASEFLKAISHKGRLLILCHLSAGEKTVGQLEDLLSARQAAVSQLLSRLRQDGLVRPRRDGKAIYYSIADERARQIVQVLYDMFCKPSSN